jgi:hypothetical protein
MEELKKEWERQLEEEFNWTPLFGKSSGALKQMKVFISSLLAKQQEEFVKSIPEEKVYNPDERHWEDPVKVDGYNQCITDIKSKLK